MVITVDLKLPGLWFNLDHVELWNLEQRPNLSAFCFVLFSEGGGEGRKVEDGPSWLLRCVSDGAGRPHPSDTGLVVAHHHCLHHSFIPDQETDV